LFATKQFTITILPQTTATPSITLLSPNGGEVLQVGQNYTIRWSSANLPVNAKISIYVTEDNDLTNSVVRDLPANLTSYVWKVTSPESNPSVWPAPLGKSDTWNKITEFFGVKTAHAATHSYYARIVVLDPAVGYNVAQDDGDGTFTISPAISTLSISTTQNWMLTGTVGKAYDVPVAVTNAASSPTPTWSVVSGQLPPGLNMGVSTGHITGTPTTEGTYYFTLQVYQNGSIATKQYYIQVIGAPAIRVTSPNGGENLTVGQNYTIRWTNINMPGDAKITVLIADDLSGIVQYISQDLSTNITSYVWNVNSPDSNPSGWDYYLGKSDTWQKIAKFFGIKTAEAATRSYKIRVIAHSSTMHAEDSTDGSFTISPATVQNPLNITTTSLSNGKVGSSYTSYINATGGTTSSSPLWTIFSGQLPPGLRLGSTGFVGYITGTPTTAGTYTFVTMVSQGSLYYKKEFTVTVAPQTVATPSVNLLNPNGGEALQAGQTYTIKWSSANLPSDASAGIILYNGAITAPYEQSKILTTNVLASAGSYTWKVAPTDVALTNSYVMRIVVQKNSAEDLLLASDTSNGTFTISPAVAQTPLVITTYFSLTDGTVGTPYSASFKTSGGTSGVATTWSVRSGKVPPGLTLSSSGYLTGTPTSAGMYSFDAIASQGNTDVGQQFNIIISATDHKPIKFPVQSLLGGTIGVPYSTTFYTTDGASDIMPTWETGMKFPVGLTFTPFANGKGGTISGTPTAPGVYVFTLTVYQGNEYFSMQNSITVVDSKVGTPSITVKSPNGGEYLQPGKEYTIKWSSANIPSNAKLRVVIFNSANTLSTTNNSDTEHLFGDEKEIVSSLPYSATSYTWKVDPSLLDTQKENPTNLYLMRVWAETNGVIQTYDTSDKVFTVSSTVKPVTPTQTVENQKNINDLQARIDELKAQIEDMKRGVAVGKTSTPTTATTGSLPADIDTQGAQDSCADIKIDLRYRSRDVGTRDDVSLLQDFLQTNNYSNSEPTGFFGVITLRAVKSFQKANDISPTGFVGPTTRAKIKTLSCSGPRG